MTPKDHNSPSAAPHDPAAHPWEKTYPPRIDWRASLPTGPVHKILEDTARHYGASPGLDFMGRKFTWAEIDAESRKIAKGLQNAGIGKGTHVGLLLPNCPVFVFAYYAVLRIGATVVHFNPLYTQRELTALIEESQTRHLITVDLKITLDKLVPLLRETRLDSIVVADFAGLLPTPKNVLYRLFKRGEIARIPDHPGLLRWDDLCANDGAYTAVDINPAQDVALLQFTGGTTGLPKAAMLTHANLVANTEQARIWFTNAREGEEKIAAVLPFFHVFAMTAILNLGTRLAMEIYALPRFDLKQTLKMIAKNRITFFPAVPAIYNAINHFPKREKYDLTSIKVCVSGGAPLPVEVKKEFEARTGCALLEGYGLTESSPVACVNPLEGVNKPGSIGLPLPQTEVALFDIENRDRRAAAGERGELCIKGPQVMKGYFNRPQETAEVLREGFLHTGDVAVMDEDGYFFIVDRIKDLIITNGYNIYPRTVEEAIYLHPAVEECIVAGIPDEARGEIVKAWIKLKPGRTITANDLKAFLQDKLSPLEMPRQIEFRTKPLPKTMIGKLSRKDILAEERAKTGSA